MRDKLWQFARRNHPEGEILTRWLKVVRWVLYPLDTLFWKMSQTRGYNWDRDEWIIHGVRYSPVVFKTLAKPDPDRYYQFRRDGELVIATTFWKTREQAAQ